MEKTIRIRWTGQDAYSNAYGPLMKGMELDVPPHVAEPWIRDGDAERVESPRVKKSSKEE